MKNGVHWKWKEGLMIKEVYIALVQKCRHEIRKAKMENEVRQAIKVKSNN